MKKRYIAYGSNMDEGQMAYRCPTARLLGQTEVEGYRLLFKGSLTGAYATIEPQEGGRVPVLIWEIGEADEASLDRYEGFPSFYYKKDLTVGLGGQEVTAMVYIMDERRQKGEPSGAYYGVLERAYEKFGFPMETLETAYRECRRDRFPGGWGMGDTCYMVTNRKKGCASPYTVQGYDGRYFELTDGRQNLYRASLGRMFRSRGAALASLQGKGVCRMRLVYDDAMQGTMAAAVGEFMDALTVGEIVRYEWGTDRVQMSMLKERLGAYLEYYRMSIGNTVTHAHGIGNNCQYPVYYHPEGVDEIQQCGYININSGMYGEGFVSCEDYNGKRIGAAYEVRTRGVKKK